MSATPKCGFCGGNLAPGVLHDPKQCAPVPEGLDFEKAATEARKGMTTELFTEWEDRYRAALNAQVAERIAEARREERALCVAELRSLKGRKIRIQSWYDGVEESAYQLTLKLPENHPIPEAR